jgi:hypothetical protein
LHVIRSTRILFYRSYPELDLSTKNSEKLFLQDIMRDVIAASELLHDGFSNWRQRLIKAGAGERFPTKVQAFLSDFFTTLNGTDVKELSNSKVTTSLCRQVVDICRQSSCVLAGGIFVDTSEETENQRLGTKVYFSNEKEIPQNGNSFIFNELFCEI